MKKFTIILKTERANFLFDKVLSLFCVVWVAKINLKNGKMKLSFCYMPH